MKYQRLYLFVLFISLTVSFPSLLDAQIPQITIHTDEEIIDEPKVAGTFIYIDNEGEILTSNIGIEIRGGFSQTFPKKTYDIEFWNDNTGSETIDVQFGDLREDDDWVLDAMYNEPLRINSFITHKLWLDLNQLYYKDQEPKAKSGADVMYVEVTINGEYQGIYLLSEQLDRSQLKLKKNTNTEIRGELYKGYTSDDAVFFNNPDEIPNNSSLKWSGYEYRYPTEIIDWTNAEEIVNFVANSTDEEFIEQVAGRFDLENIMDYFILLNIARLLDNRGKNVYLCRYDAGEPYFLAPWDLDGSWGLLWNGNNDTTTKGILTNNLFDRLILTDVDNYRQKISDKWNSYRLSLVSDSALENTINTAHQFLKENGIYEKESEVWDYEYSEADLDYMFNWLGKRLDFLDEYFDNITDVNEVEASSNIKIFPNPAQEYITISGDFDKDEIIRIYDLIGGAKRVYSLPFNEDRIYVDDLNPGMYILEIGSSKRIFHKI